MDWLNYHHLHYFWVAVREGGIAAASRRLGVGRPAISAQIKSLEAAVGQPLFRRRGRRLELTETGKLVHRYAEDIFSTGRELMGAVRGLTPARSVPLRVGIADVMAKLVAFRLLEPAMDLEEPLVLEVREDQPMRLFAELAVHELDLVLSDVPLTAGLDVRAHSHEMGESTTSLFAAPELARDLKPGWPGSLEGVDFLMPSRSAAMRGGLELWLEASGLHPRVRAEFEDSALLQVFGQAGRGVFPAPTIVSAAVCSQYEVEVLAELETVRERFYAITPERKIEHPGVARIVDSARSGLFA